MISTESGAVDNSVLYKIESDIKKSILCVTYSTNIYWVLLYSRHYAKHALGIKEIMIETCSQFSSVVAQSCQTLCDPMNRSMPGLPVHHKLPEFTQTHAHQVGDAI